MVGIKELQRAELDILKEIIVICERHNLTWFAIGGTLLGAVRHKGFIPWDDDIDIGLPRKDYEKLLQYAQEELPEPYQVLRGAGKYEFLFAKIHNKNTTFIEQVCKGKTQWYKGVFVDIMPFDGIPNSTGLQNVYYPIVRGLSILYNNRRFGKSKGKSMGTKITNLLPSSAIYKLWDTVIRSVKFEKSKKTCFTWSARNKSLTFETALFSDLVWHDFEDIQIKIPRDYHSYLTTHYGDYMQIPPASQQNCHGNHGIVDLERSFVEYIEEE